MKGDDSTMGALSHIRVLDLTRVLAPVVRADACRFRRGRDQGRAPGRRRRHTPLGPPYLKDADGADTAEAAYYLAANRNKRSVTVDIATPEGQQIVREPPRRATSCSRTTRSAS